MTGSQLYEAMKNISPAAVVQPYTMQTCERLVPLINRINELKKEKNAVVLAHYYVSPEIVAGVADYVGDSYKLALDARQVEADMIVFAAVRFMGETAKILNPTKTVLVPGYDGGCSLAEAIDAQTVRNLRVQYPEHTFVCYINTTAGVKAVCDVCVTSSNVYDIIERLPSDKIFFLPDLLMGQNIIREMTRRGIHKSIELYDGNCYVHKEYDGALIDAVRMSHQIVGEDVAVIAHPECRPEVVAKSDFTGSTSQMTTFLESSPVRNVMLLTECGLNAGMQARFPERRFIGSCNMCRYMKSNTLSSILQALENPAPAMHVDIEEAVCSGAERCISAMFRYAAEK